MKEWDIGLRVYKWGRWLRVNNEKYGLDEENGVIVVWMLFYIFYREKKFG